MGRLLELLQRRSKQHSRKQKGSANRKKSALRLARLHRRIKNQRLDFLHKISTRLARTKSAIVIEDLSVTRMLCNHRLARHIADAGWGEFRRMLGYKTKWYGSRLIVAPRFYPSSRTCSECRSVKPTLALSERKFVCENCGVILNRDENAARNLAYLSTASSAGSNACGEGRFMALARCPSMKQEPNAIWACPKWVSFGERPGDHGHRYHGLRDPMALSRYRKSVMVFGSSSATKIFLRTPAITSFWKLGGSSPRPLGRPWYRWAW